MLRVFIIGGTAFMGPHVVRLLAEAGHEVTVFHRGQTAAELPDGTATVIGDRDERETLRSAITSARPDVVLDMMALEERQAEALVAAVAGSGVRVVLASSIDVYRSYGKMTGMEPGAPEPMPLDEHAPLRHRLYPYRTDAPRAANAPDRWMDAYDKIPVERAVLTAPDLRTTVLRLPMVYGPADRQHRTWQYLQRMDAGRSAILLGATMARWRAARGYVENVAAAIARCVAREPSPQISSTSSVDRAIYDAIHDAIYNVASTPTLDEAGWVRAIGEAAGWHGEVIVAPDQEMPDALRPPFDATHHLDVDSSFIRQETGWREYIGLAEGLQRTVAWQRANPPDWPEPDYAIEDEVLAKSRRV